MSDKPLVRYHLVDLNGQRLASFEALAPALAALSRNCAADPTSYDELCVVGVDRNGRRVAGPYTAEREPPGSSKPEYAVEVGRTYYGDPIKYVPPRDDQTADVRDSLRPVEIPTLLCGHRRPHRAGHWEMFCELPAGHDGYHETTWPEESWPHEASRTPRRGVDAYATSTARHDR